MASTIETLNSPIGLDNNIERQSPSWIRVTSDARQIWESYRNVIEYKTQRHYPMPATFEMVPVRMNVMDINGVKTYFFKGRVPNNKYVNVRVRLSGKAESHDSQVTVESCATGDVDEPITKMF